MGQCRKLKNDDSRCQNEAVTTEGFCRVHDPELVEQRRIKLTAQRGPSIWDRRMAAGHKLVDFLKDRLSAEEADYAKTLFKWSKHHETPPWPLPEPPDKQRL